MVQGRAAAAGELDEEDDSHKSEETSPLPILGEGRVVGG